MTGSPGETTVRTDRDPISSRFPALGEFAQVQWLGRRLGDDRAPGPSTYAIDAVVLLTAPDLTRLRQDFDLSPAPDPEVEQALRPFLAASGAGAWQGSAELDRQIVRRVGPRGCRSGSTAARPTSAPEASSNAQVGVDPVTELVWRAGLDETE